MIDISFEVNGRKVSPNNMGNAIEAAMLNSIKDSVSQSVGSIRCTEHGQKPKINLITHNPQLFLQKVLYFN